MIVEYVPLMSGLASLVISFAFMNIGKRKGVKLCHIFWNVRFTSAELQKLLEPQFIRPAMAFFYVGLFGIYSAAIGIVIF